MVTEFQTPDKESMKVLQLDNCGLATAARLRRPPSHHQPSGSGEQAPFPSPVVNLLSMQAIKVLTDGKSLRRAETS
jgi:hypothetical protein